jgi:hypothetical protein
MSLNLDLKLWLDSLFNTEPSPDLYANNADIVISTSATLAGIPQSLAASTSQIGVQSSASLENKKDLSANNSSVVISSSGEIAVAKPLSVLTGILIASEGLLAVTKVLAAATSAITVNSTAGIQVNKNFSSQVDIRISTAGDLSVGGGASAVLDSLPASSFAYGLRKLRTAYSGNAIRVRRSSDNVETDIGFDGSGNLDTTALLAHCGAGNGFITTWYDQSTNGRNATNTSASTQPQIVASGAVINLASTSRPTIRFTGASSTRLDSATFSVPQPYSLTTVYNYYTSLSGNNPIFYGGNSGAAYTGYYSPSNQFIMYCGNIVNSNGGRATNTNYVNTSSYDGASSNSFSNGTNVAASINPGNVAIGQARIANDVGLNGAFATVDIPEMILFPSVLSTGDRNTLERNQGTYFGITVA